MLANKDKGDRKQQRQAAGRLRDLVLQAGTLKRYEAAATRFLSWLDRSSLQPKSADDIDEVASLFIEHLWDEGDPKGYAGDLICSLQHEMPMLKGRLRGAWRLLKTWDEHELPSRAPPLLVDMVLAMAGAAMLRKDHEAAVGYMVAFQTLLRTGELLGLKVADIVFADDLQSAVLNLGLTKGGARRGVEESVILDDPRIVLFLAAVVAGKDGATLLLPRSSYHFRRNFAADVKRVGLSLEYRPYSFRRGGATHLYRTSNNIGACTVRGRWASQTTARKYIDEALSEISASTMAARERQSINEFKAYMLECLE